MDGLELRASILGAALPTRLDLRHGRRGFASGPRQVLAGTGGLGDGAEALSRALEAVNVAAVPLSSAHRPIKRLHVKPVLRRCLGVIRTHRASTPRKAAAAQAVLARRQG